MCLLVVIAGFAGLYSFRLGGHDLWSSHEARAAQNAQSILDAGCWDVPRLFDESAEMQKPAGYYWLVAMAGWCRGGVDAVGVRLPAMLAAVGVLTCVAIGLRQRPTAAMFAVLALGSMPHFVLLARTGRIDMTLTLAVTATLMLDRAGRRILAGIACGVGLLLKGPLALVLPLGVMTIDDTRRFAEAYESRPLLRIVAYRCLIVVVALLIAAPWYIHAHLATHGAFTRSFFIYHHFQRAAGGADALAAHPWYLYAVRWCLDACPWCFAAPAVVWAARRSDRDLRLGLVWCVAVTLLLSLSRFKRADYLLPAYPGFAIALGCTLERIRFARPACLAVASTIALGWLCYIVIAAPSLEAQHDRKSWATEVRSHTPGVVLLFRVEDHLLTWHLGRPVNTFREWENLQTWVARPESVVVLMPKADAERWSQYITTGRLEPLAEFTDRSDRERPRHLCLMRSVPP